MLLANELTLLPLRVVRLAHVLFPPSDLHTITTGFCRRCDLCPTCASSLSTACTATSVAAPAPAHVPAPATSYAPPGGPQAPVIPMNVSQRAKHQAEVQDFRDAQEATAKGVDDLANVFRGLGITDDGPIDNLANVFTGLVVTDDGPDVRGQQHSRLFSSRDAFQDSIPNVPLTFQLLSPSEAISSIQSFVNTAPKRTAPPTRKEQRASTLTDVLGRIRTAQQSLDLVYELYVTNSDHDSVQHHFEDPIGDHNTVSQIVILFAIISNVVIGLVTDPCNFLIDTVTLIINLTMSLSSPLGAEYNAKQRDVLSQLPTRLEDALKTFKLEPKTRILATCPPCHYTHEPRVNRLTEPSYPTHCENFIFRDKHSPVQCLEPLLDRRKAKVRLIKPFVYPDSSPTTWPPFFPIPRLRPCVIAPAIKPGKPYTRH
ncbi:hypothetical protein B0H13DRAFT_2333138 [Mycena leptocephala]|nr:hypothetical protein B0H13DRAFT_2333138 [Mycena leptocephala]